MATLASLLGATSCGDDDGIAGSGTGGDELPDDDEPGPRGPSCEPPRSGRPTLGGAHDITAQAQPAMVMGEVAFEGKPPEPPAPRPSHEGAARAATSPSLPLVAGGRPTGATTQAPHIHERWGESRKLELSYCITGITGDDAEKEARYHSLIRSFFDTSAEWERITGANFVHIVADDTPDHEPEAPPGADGHPALRPDCATGTKSYFGVLTYPFGAIEALTNRRGGRCAPRVALPARRSRLRLRRHHLDTAGRRAGGHALGVLAMTASLMSAAREGCSSDGSRGMTRLILASLLGALSACGPEVVEEPEPPGVLEYEHPHVRIYRLDRRVDTVLVQPSTERRECGMLSERAQDDLEATLDALDPHEDYGYDPDHQECISPPGAWIHIEGFDYSPFSCEWYCCRPELMRAALIYSAIESHYLGGGVDVDGEPYVVLEPDEPCP